MKSKGAIEAAIEKIFHSKAGEHVIANEFGDT
jgi:hypothetical protein